MLPNDDYIKVIHFLQSTSEKCFKKLIEAGLKTNYESFGMIMLSRLLHSLVSATILMERANQYPHAYFGIKVCLRPAIADGIIVDQMINVALSGNADEQILNEISKLIRDNLLSSSNKLKSTIEEMFVLGNIDRDEYEKSLANIEANKLQILHKDEITNPNYKISKYTLTDQLKKSNSILKPLLLELFVSFSTLEHFNNEFHKWMIHDFEKKQKEILNAVTCLIHHFRNIVFVLAIFSEEYIEILKETADYVVAFERIPI